jgi:regulator of nucleoside diphosphate kinase
MSENPATGDPRLAAKPPIVVSDTDYARLTTLARDAEKRFPRAANDLLAEMERAQIVPPGALPQRVVRMGSHVVFRADDGRTRNVELVFPGRADIGAGRVSILTPIGAALIGLAEGQSITWQTREGQTRRLTIVSVKSEAEETVD